MVVLVTSLTAPTCRAQRLLKLYPKLWRQRYGDEFVDLMEQSIADQPHNAKRTLNIIFKSFKVRLSDLGIAGPALENANASRSALSTTTVLATVFTVFALFYWSCAMVSWNSNPNVATSVPVTLWTGAITVSTMILSVTLLGIGITFFFRAMKSVFSRRKSMFRWTPIVALVSTIVILNGVHQFIRFTIARGGIQWFNSGVALKQVAGATQSVTQSIIWGPSWTGGNTFSQGLLHISTTVALVVLAVSVAKLIRESEFSVTATRAGVRATKLLSVGMFLFIFSFVGWELAGGFSNSWEGHFTQMQKSLFFVITSIGLLSLMISLKIRNTDNSIHIVSSPSKVA